VDKVLLLPEFILVEFGQSKFIIVVVVGVGVVVAAVIVPEIPSGEVEVGIGTVASQGTVALM